jgi:hypothetical protein
VLTYTAGVFLAASGRHAGEACRRLVEAVAMDLPALIIRLEAAAGHAIDEDKPVGSLCEALVHLLVLDRLAGQRRTPREGIAQRAINLANDPSGPNMDPEAIRQKLRKDIFLGVTLHEMGHNVGLRHNFRASFDALNYFPKYWELRDAAAKNLKPQMLAVAAIAKLGGTRGDVLATATSMAEVLDKLTIQLGNELADDCLLTIAVYDQGAAGDTMKMRNMLQELANKSSESSRTIRTIWFLQKEGKISPSQFDMALTFLAAGTIAQNPKEFGVNAEALDL